MQGESRRPRCSPARSWVSGGGEEAALLRRSPWGFVRDSGFPSFTPPAPPRREVCAGGRALSQRRAVLRRAAGQHAGLRSQRAPLPREELGWCRDDGPGLPIAAVFHSAAKMLPHWLKGCMRSFGSFSSSSCTTPPSLNKEKETSVCGKRTWLNSDECKKPPVRKQCSWGTAAPGLEPSCWAGVWAQLPTHRPPPAGAVPALRSHPGTSEPRASAA